VEVLIVRVLVAGAVLAGCIEPGAFDCTEDEQCDPDGVCEPVGACSFPDAICPSGRRFSEYADPSIADECTDELGEAWWDDGFARRRRIDVEPLASAEPLEDVPILVVLDATRIDYASAGPDGSSVRFVGEAGAPLAFEIERWDAMGASFVWVGVPRLDGDGDVLWMYWDHDDPPPAPDGSPWAGYAGVWHLGDGARDSGPSGNDGTASGAIAVEGRIGDGHRLASPTDYVDVGADESLADVFAQGGTVSAWVLAEDWGPSGYGRIADKSADESSTDGWSLLLANDGESIETFRFAKGFSTGHAGWSAPQESLRLGAWQHIVVSYDASAPTNNPQLYVDGQPQSLVITNPAGGEAQSDAGRPLRLGNTSEMDPVEDSRAFTGILDEVRLERTVRSPTWVTVQVASTTDALLQFGPEERRP
jgi:hypothetical protein